MGIDAIGEHMSSVQAVLTDSIRHVGVDSTVRQRLAAFGRLKHSTSVPGPAPGWNSAG